MSTSSLVNFDQVHIVLTRPNASGQVLDTIINFPAGADSLELTLPVDISSASEQLTLVLEYVDQPGNNVVFTVGPVTVTASVSGNQQNTLPPPIYVGPGANAAGIRFVTTQSSVYFQDSVTLTAEALDASNNVMAGVPIRWTSSDTTRAIMRTDSLGRVVAKSVRGAVNVSASLLRTSPTVNPPSVSHGVTVQPRATTVTPQAGNAQTGAVGAALPQPVVARVLASDNLGVQGVVVTFAVLNGGGSLSVLVDTTDANGDAQTSWTLGSILGAQAVTATVAGLPVATINFGATAIAAPPVRLLFQQEPTNANEAAVIAPAITVRAVDQFGNLNSSFTGNVTLAILDNPGGGALSGTATQAAAGGVATFNNLSINLAGNGYTLRASSGTLGTDTSAAFNVIAVTPVSLAFLVEPTNTGAGNAITPAVQVRLVTASGSTATGATNPVTIAIGNNPAGGTISGTLTVNAVAGVATFSNLSIDNIGNGYTLAASSAGLPTTGSASFNVVASPVANFWINTSGGNWNTAANWSRGTVPGPTDTVEIRQCGTYTVQLDVNITVEKLSVGCPTSGTQTLKINGFTMTVNSRADILTRGVLQLDNGTITGTGLTEVAGRLDWTNGGFLNTTTRVLAAGSLDLTGASVNRSINGGLLENAGDFFWAGTGNLSMHNSAILRNLPGGTFEQQGDGPLNWSTGSQPSFDNQGLLLRSTSAGTTTWTVAYTGAGAGSLVVQTGKLVLAGGGASSTAMSVVSGAVLEFQGTGAIINGAVSGAGEVRIGAGSTTFAGGYNVTGVTRVAAGTVNFTGTGTTRVLDLIGGAQGGSGLLTVSDSLYWTGGTFNGTGTTRVPSGGRLEISGAGGSRALDTRVLESFNTLWTGTGGVNASNAAVFRTLAGGTLVHEADAGINWSSGSQPRHENLGTFTRSVAVSLPIWTTAFDNSGSVAVQTGALMLNGGGTSPGSFNIGLAGTLGLNGSGAVISGAVSGAGLVVTTGGSTTFTGNYALTGITRVSGSGAFLFNNAATASTRILQVLSGTQGGTGVLEVTDSLLWSGGTLNGGGVTRVLASGRLDIAGGSTKQIDTRVLELAGPSLWASTATIFGSNIGTIRNLPGATFELQSDADFTWSSGSQSRFDNQGTLLRSAGGAGIASWSSAMDNSGQVTVSGPIDFTNGGTSSGTFTVGSGMTLGFNGTHALSGTVTGPGDVSINGGTSTATGTWTVTGTTALPAGTLVYNGAGTGSTNTLNLSGGNLGGSGTFQINSSGSWTAGTMSGSGTTRIPSGVQLTMSGVAGKTQDQRTLEISGTVLYSGTSWSMSNAGVARTLPGGLLDLANDGQINWSSGTQPAIDNQGTLRRSAGTGVMQLDPVLTHTGGIQVQAGVLELNPSGATNTLAGSATLSAGTTLRFASGTQSATSAFTIAGGTVELTGGTFAIGVGDSVVVPNWQHSNGTLTGAGVLRLAGTGHTWTGGSMSGTGTTRIPAGSVLTLSGVGSRTQDTRLVEISGTLNYAGGAAWSMSNGATARTMPGSLMDIQGDGQINWSSGAQPVIDNQGTLRRSAGTGVHQLDPIVNHSGSMQVQTGILELNASSATNTLNGPATLSAGTTLRFTSGTQSATSAFVPTGGTLELTGGTFTIGAGDSVVAANWQHSNGTLSGAGVLRLLGTANTWTGGTMSGAGTTRIPVGATLTLSGATGRSQDTRTIDILGTLAYPGSNWSMLNGSVLEVRAGGLLDIQADGQINWSSGTQPRIELSGTLRRSAGAGVHALDPILSHVGTLEVQTGTLELNASSATNFLAGPTTVSTGAILRFVSGNQSANSNFVPTGAGSLELTGGVFEVNGTDSVVVANWTHSAGIVSGTGVLRMSGTNNAWTGGTMMNAGTTRVPAGAQLLIGGAVSKVQDTRLIEISGIASYNGTNWSMANGAVTRTLAAGTLNLQTIAADVNWSSGAQPTIDNGGNLFRHIGTGVMTVDPLYSGTGNLTVSTGTLQLNGGSGATFSGAATATAGVLDLSSGAFALSNPWNITGNLTVSGATLNLNGRALSVSGNLVKSGGILQMINAADSLDINGNATFSGGTTALTAGVIRLAGNFVQTGSNTFTGQAQSATVAHRVVLDGTAGVTTSVSFANPVNSFFRRLTVAKPGGSTVRLDTDVRTTFFSMAGGTYSMTGAGGVTTQRLIADTVAGANSTSVGMFSPMVLEVNSVLVDSNVINVDTIVFTGANQVIQNTYPGGPAGRYTLQNVRVAQTAGTATFGANTTIAQDLIVSSGTLGLTGRVITVNGDFRTETSGLLGMTTATDSLKVTGDVDFSGGTTSSTLTNGVITVAGNFSQGGRAGGTSTAYTPTSTALNTVHRLVMNGTGAQTISIGNPTSSRFDVLRTVATNSRIVTFLTDAETVDSLHMTAGSSAYTMQGPTARVRVGGVLRLDQQTGSPSISSVRLLELTQPPSLAGLANGLTADTIAYLPGTVATLPVGSNITYNNIRLSTNATVTMAPDTIAGNLNIATGTALFSGANTFQIGGNLTTSGAAAFSQTNAGSRVVVIGDATFAGGNSTAITNGVLEVRRDFTQSTNAQAFQASGAHETNLAGGVGASRQRVSFANPGTGANSRFARLRIGRNVSNVHQSGSLLLITNAQANMLVDSTQGTTIDTLVANTATQIMTIDTMQANDVVFEGTRLALGNATTGGTSNHSTGNIVFRNMTATQTFVTVNRSTGTAATLNGFTMNSTPSGGGLYVHVNALSTATVSFPSSTPAGGTVCPLSTRTGVATLTWAGTTCP